MAWTNRKRTTTRQGKYHRSTISWNSKKGGFRQSWSFGGSNGSRYTVSTTVAGSRREISTMRLGKGNWLLQCFTRKLWG